MLSPAYSNCILQPVSRIIPRLGVSSTVAAESQLQPQVTLSPPPKTSTVRYNQNWKYLQVCLYQLTKPFWQRDDNSSVPPRNLCIIQHVFVWLHLRHFIIRWCDFCCMLIRFVIIHHRLMWCGLQFAVQFIIPSCDSTWVNDQCSRSVFLFSAPLPSQGRATNLAVNCVLLSVLLCTARAGRLNLAV